MVSGGVARSLVASPHHWVLVHKYPPPDSLKTRVEKSELSRS